MATTVIVYPSGTTENTNPHVLFSGGTGATYTIEMTTSGELLFSQDVEFTRSGVISSVGTGHYITGMFYNTDNQVMYFTSQDSSTNDYSISGFSGSNDTLFSTTFYDDLRQGVAGGGGGQTGYGVTQGPSNVVYVLGEFTGNSKTAVRRINITNSQVTHEYTGGTSVYTSGTYYEYNSNGYLAFAERYNSDNVLTILNASDLSLVGRYSYDEYNNDSNNYFQQLIYANGKLLWSMPNRTFNAAVGCTTQYGQFNLSNNTFTTGSTQPHSTQWTGYVLMDGTEKVYGVQIEASPGFSDFTGVTYGYYDYSAHTFTELGSKEISDDVNQNVLYLNGLFPSKKDSNGDMYLISLYDLIIINGSTGTLIETENILDLSSNVFNDNVTFTAVEYNQNQDKLWVASYLASNGALIDTY